MKQDLSNRVVVVTGAGRGIGRALVQRLSASGAQVALCDIDLALARQVASEVETKTISERVDVSDHAAFSAFLDQTERELGPIDVLINNAGIMPLSPFVDESEATVAQQLEINLSAVIFGSKEAVRRMQSRGRGHIINISSSAGKLGFPHGVTYCATKFGVVGLSEALRLELAGSGIEVSVVMPGVVKTELATGLKTPIGVRAVTAEEVADAIVRAICWPKFQVFVPPNIGPILSITAALPTKIRVAIARLLRADIALTQVDPKQRKAYEERAAASAPSKDQ